MSGDSVWTAVLDHCDRFHNSWVGSRVNVRERLEQFAHCYNHQRPHQLLDKRTPSVEVLT
nr:integrase core domain-containing protein [Halorubrum aquaticum]